MSLAFDAFGGGSGAKAQFALLDFTRLKILPRRLLGTGSSARVYEGRWCGKVCAVKVLFTVEIVPEEIDRTCLEASLLHRLQSSSVHVVRLFGVAVLPPSLCVVLELCSEGSLADVLYGKSDGRRQTSFDSNLSAISKKGSLQQTYLHELPWASRLELALGASRGVDAFARTFPGLSHNDVKSTNFLVDCPGPDAGGGLRYVVKIADVEFASHGVTPEHTRRGESPHWTAPEVLSGAAPVSPSSDVFALGSVLFEIMARQVPFGDFNDQDAAAQIQAGKRPLAPECAAGMPLAVAPAVSEFSAMRFMPSSSGPSSSCDFAVELASRAQFRALIKSAWAQDPSARPTAGEAAEELEAMLREVSKPEARS
jgi:serine/threonine protein kinase